MTLLTACPACCGTRAHEKSCPARSVPVSWPAADTDDVRAQADREYAERMAAYAARRPAWPLDPAPLDWPGSP